MTSSYCARVQNVDLIFPSHLFRPTSLRDEFTSWLKNPAQKLFRPRKIVHALKGVNLTVSKGERLGILGTNGSGKTSLCRCLANILAPTSGRIDLQVRPRAIFDSNIGLDHELTGRENAELLAIYLYGHLAERQSIIDEAIEFSELGDFIDIPLKTYSKGMKVRLFLSLISARPAELLILDEVFDGADHFFQAKMSRRVSNLILDSSSAVLVSHNTEILKSICTRIIVMRNGEIVEEGPPDSLIDAYLAGKWEN